MCSTHIATFPDNNALSNSLNNNLFLDGFNSSPGWLLVTRTRGSWWCRYRGHCRSGPRHLSPRSRVCAQEWHCKDFHSHIHSHTPMHAPKKKKRKKKKRREKCSTHQTWCLPLLVLFLSVFWLQTCRKLGTSSTSEALSPRTILTENICESVQQILQHSQAEKNVQLTKHDDFVYWSSSCPMWWWPTARKLIRCSSGLFHVGGLLA